MSGSNENGNRATDMLLESVGVGDPAYFVMVTGIGLTIQALVIGSALQLLYTYSKTPCRETVAERFGLGIVWIIAIAQVVTNNIQSAWATASVTRYTDFVLLDWWFYQLSSMYYNIALSLLFAFFSKRAWIIWDRNKWVLALVIGFAVPTVTMGIVASALGLQAPWGLKFFSNEEFNRWLPVWYSLFSSYKSIFTVSIVLQLATNLLLCVLILYGLWRHRNGFKQMDTAISKIVFTCSESLVPSVLLSVIFVVGIGLIANPDSNTEGVLLTRLCGQVCPSVYLHSLMSSLVSRQRVKRILQAEPVRYLPSIQDPSPNHLGLTPAQAYKHDYALQQSSSNGANVEQGLQVEYVENHGRVQIGEESGSFDEKARSTLMTLPTFPPRASASGSGSGSGKGSPIFSSGSNNRSRGRSITTRNHNRSIFPNTHPIAKYKYQYHSSSSPIVEDHTEMSFQEFISQDLNYSTKEEWDEESHVSLRDVDIRNTKDNLNDHDDDDDDIGGGGEEEEGWRRGSRRSTYLYKIEDALRRGPPPPSSITIRNSNPGTPRSGWRGWNGSRASSSERW